MTDSSHGVLLKTIRNGFLDCSYWGSVYLASGVDIVSSFGLNPSEICFLRSLAKPLQASAIADTSAIEGLMLNEFDLAIAQGSHTGTEFHIKILKKFAYKTGIKISDLELCPDFPIDMSEFRGIKTKFHNNCSGKHLLMAAASKYLGFPVKNYTSPCHPIQKLIYKKQTELSEFESDILTFDGCSTPLWGLPIKNLIIAYNNYFHNQRYYNLIHSILENPYVFGGSNRLDSEIIRKSKKKLFSKVGAGGFVLVYNFKEDMTLVVKMAQNNNEIRRLVTLNLLNRLGWLRVNLPEFVLTQKGQKVATYCYETVF